MLAISFLRRATVLLAAFLAIFAGTRARAVTAGQDDTFQAGTIANWATGAAQPVNVPDGGPAGAGDRFMELTADGSGANGRLTVFNRSQWVGDYISAGVTEIDMDLNNFSSVTLSIRLAFKSATFNGAPGYVSTTGLSLAPNSGWQHAVFFIAPGAMTAVGGPTAFSSFFTAPAELRIINSTSTSDLNGNTVVGQLGVDNIIALPEPGSLGLFGSAGVLFGLLRWPSHHRRGLGSGRSPTGHGD